MRHSTALPARGFTLIELMIVVAVVAILASVAYPSYTEFVERARRKDATASMLEAQQFAERYFTEKKTYVGVNVAMPTSLKQSPREGTKIWYNIGTNGAETATSYTVSATPNSWTPKKCGTLSVSQIGIRSISNPAAATADNVSECFNR
jgi:type IV pilus assembly protein PilE